MPSATATSLGFFGLTGAASGAAGYGDGNGYVQQSSGCTRESLVFWRQLSEANLIDGSYGADSADPITTSGIATIDTTNPSIFVPLAKISNNNYFTANSDMSGSGGWKKYFQIMGLASITATPPYCTGTYNAWAEDAYAIDAKLDNGIPSYGRIISQDPGNGSCYSSGQYSLGSTTAGCQIKIIDRF